MCICIFFSTFALDMRKLAIIVALCTITLCAHAETLLLHTGARVKGEIVFQNEEVVIIRNADGARFQYPRADVKEIITDDDNGQGTDDPANIQMVNDQMVNKKASILLELAGGAAYMPGAQYGGTASVDLLVGSHHIKDRHLFIGGGLGYHGIFMGEKNVYNFLPVQVALRMPLTEKKHAPAFGIALGYGIGLSKEYTGGLYAGVDFGYRCQLNPKSAVGVAFFTQFQQAKLKAEETVEDISFVGEKGLQLITFGAKFTLYF